MSTARAPYVVTQQPLVSAEVVNSAGPTYAAVFGECAALGFTDEQVGTFMDFLARLATNARRSASRCFYALMDMSVHDLLEIAMPSRIWRPQGSSLHMRLNLSLGIPDDRTLVHDDFVYNNAPRCTVGVAPNLPPLRT